MMKENLAKIGDLGCAKVIEEEKPQSEKASEDVAEQKNEKVINVCSKHAVKVVYLEY